MSIAHDGPGHPGGWHYTKEAKEKIRRARLSKPHPYKRNPERGWKINQVSTLLIGERRIDPGKF
jgi:hypothetical protein